MNTFKINKKNKALINCSSADLRFQCNNKWFSSMFHGTNKHSFYFVSCVSDIKQKTDSQQKLQQAITRVLVISSFIMFHFL